LAKYDTATDKYIYNNVTYTIPSDIPPAAPLEEITLEQKNKISKWVEAMKRTKQINNDVIPRRLVYEFINNKFIIEEPGPSKETVKYEPPERFLKTYASYVEETNSSPPDNPAPRLSTDSIDLLIKNPGMIGGGQYGGTMEDFQVFDIMTGISETMSRKVFAEEANVKIKENEFIEKKEKKNAEEIANALGTPRLNLPPRKRGDRGKPFGGAMGDMLRGIIENGPFVNNKSTITYDLLQKLRPYIIAFYGVVRFPVNQGEYDIEIEEINKSRAAKVLTVTSWLRSVPNKTKITEKDIAEIVPDSLTFKQFVDILSEMVSVENKKQTIKLDKDIFKKATDVVPPSYVLDTTIKLLTDQLSDNIEIKHIITYFEKGGRLYTFFHFKNVMRLLYDYRFGDISYDKIIINLSKIVGWLKTTKVNKITNANIEAFKTNNSTVSMDVLVDTLHYLIKQKVTIDNKVIRVGDFGAIETLDPDNVDINTKVIAWLIDPKRATLPKPTETQIAAFKVVIEGNNPTSGSLKMATLFVGPFQLSSELTKGSDKTTPEVNENVKTFGLLQEIQNTIKKRTDAKKADATAEKLYKTGIREKEAAEYVKETEAAQYRKMIEESNEKDKRIEELNKAIEKAKTDASEETVKKDIEKRFTDKLAEAIKQKEYRSLEALLKERNADLAKEYAQVKSNENKGGELKPPEAIKGEWGNLIGKIKAMNGDHGKLLLAINEFRKTHTDAQVKPEYKSIDGMFNALWAKFGKKKGGYHETLRNHLRSRRHTYRRL
jgi:hypothetical protein